MSKARETRVARGGARVNLMYLPGVLLVLTSLWAGPAALAFGLVGAVLWAVAAALTRDGLAAEQAFYDRAFARKPALPRKIIGCALVGIGTGLAALAHGIGAGGAAIYGAIAAGLHLAAFGPDPLRDRLPEGVDARQSDRMAPLLSRAEEHLAAMHATIAALRDRALNEQVVAFEDTARHLIERIEADPRDLVGARRYLGVYLMGARDASEKFAAHYARSQSRAARLEYEALLRDLQQNFAARTEKMLQDDATDMSIEIEVLRERLQRPLSPQGTEAP